MFVYLRFLVFIAAASVVVHAAFLQDAPEAEDPILKFQINHPQNGSVVTLPLKVSCRMSVKSIELYSTHYAGMLACIEIQDAETKCNPVLDSDIVFHELPEGQHTVRAYIANRSEGGARRHLTETVTFSIVSATEFEEYTEDLVRRSRENLKLPRDLDILEWAQQQHVQGQGARHDLDAALSSGDVDVPRLVIGIKTAVLSNFPRRQAIRETWGKQTTLSRVKVIFLGCSPSMVDVDDERHQQLFREAVALEKVVYGDFLTGELNCEDSYRLLTEKVKAFYQFAATTFPQTPYVMIADDDVYLRVEKLVSLLDGLGSTRRIYLGQAWNSVFSRTPTPVRDEFHKNYLPREQYPMRELLPYAFGAHYVISMDCSRPARANPNTIGDVLHPTKPSVSDPETSVEIMYPLNGSMEKPPVTFTTQIHVRPGQTEKFTDLYNGKYLCIETRGRELVANVTRSCSRIGGTEVVIQHNQLGDFSSRAYIARTTAPDDVRYWQSSDVMFSVVHEADLAALIARRIEEQGQFYPDYDLGIVEWAAQQQRLQDTELVRRLGEDQPVFGGLSSAARSKKYEGDEEDLMLVVGIKTALVTGFAFRQAIRQTWASKEALPSGVKVFFIGCRPTTNKGVGNYSADAVGDNVSDFRRLWGAIQLEKLVYGDVLTDELDCADSNAFLAKKVKEFLHFTATRYAHAQYVMIADDNLYVRMDTVVHQLRAKASRLRFYGGDFQTKGNNTVLTTAQYPMGELPPFAIDPAALPLIVAYAPHASFSRLVLESLFASVFQEKKRPVLVMPENILRSHYGVSPDVFVFSVLGVRCNPVSTPECQEMVAEYFHRYGASSSTNQEPHTTHFVMLSGEAWSAEGLDERVLLLSTVANVNRAKHVYLSMASLSFGERLDHGPMSLLSASGKFEAKTKFCAYLYAHCEHRDRETMFDELNALRPVDALGICAGSSRPPDHARIASRETMFYNDDAIRRYAPYKFVIAFENSPVAGYVTEKLVNAFLAGSIPIYMGDSATVSGLFNPKSFIDCGQFESLRDCAMYVVQVDDSLEIYTRMLREPPVTNLTAFNDAFSWHPTVPSRATADAVLKHLTNEEKG
ncbi:hypothetical protein PF001_g3521 [Phytophthora fragariae]|uniref:Fucosyltransferase n=1 Tax=Phytophthora fragariae TaxID=53985 RepID=A0A6A4ETS5_9STRA|nr:hypothetical protein PF001_g3521 [Phytophthora fragariae]